MAGTGAAGGSQPKIVKFSVPSTTGFAQLDNYDVEKLLSANQDELLSVLAGEHRMRPREWDMMHIFVLRSVAGAEPTALEERDAVELPDHVPLGIFISNQANGITPSPHGKVFLLVGPRDILTRASQLINTYIFKFLL